MAMTLYWDPVDPDQSPLELFNGNPNGSFSMVFREGGRVKVSRHPGWMPKTLFTATLNGSLSLEGQPIRCTGFVPGVTLRIIATQSLTSSLCGTSAERFVEQAWREIGPLFESWHAAPHSPPGMELEFSGATACFARHAEWEPRPGVMQIDVSD